MTIRNRLTLLFTAIVSSLLLVFCLVNYLVAESHRRNEYSERLHAEALTSAELLFGPDSVGRQLYKLLDKNHMTVLNQEEIIIYNYRNQIVYESGTDYLNVSKNQLDQVRLRERTYWQVGDREVVGVRYLNHHQPLVVLASAVDKYGFSKQRKLAGMLAAGWLLATVVVFGAGYLYAGRALSPIRQIIRQIDTITASQLAQRLTEGASPDEITQLAQRFNRMLARLEDAFQLQRNFVSHASHELRTPLTAITGQLEVALLAEEDLDELRETIGSVLDDVRDLNRLTNGLMSLANLGVDESAVVMGPVDIEDLTELVRAELGRLRPEFIITLSVDPPEQGSVGFGILGSEALLRRAVFNLMENGGKFASDHRVQVKISADRDTVSLTFNNYGPSIDPSELADIFKPFRRGTNGRSLPGHGIGLSLTQRIVQLHRGRITVESDVIKGTTFQLIVPRQ